MYQGIEEEDKKHAILFYAFSNLKSGEYNQALEILDQFLHDHPQEIFFKELLGDVYFLSNQYKNASIIYKELINLSNNKERILFKNFLLHLYDSNLSNACMFIDQLYKQTQKQTYLYDKIIIEALCFTQ